LTGWFSIEDHIRPARFSLSKLDREALKTLPQRAHGMRDPASMLGLVAWEKSCLVEHILPALGGASGNPDYLLKLLSALAEQATEIADPVFFNY
jgi:hypothetical protein